MIENAAINIENLSKKFNDKTIFENLYLEVKKGEIFGFLGRNGAGKSTLINTFTGINRKLNGKFQLNGIDDTHLNEAKKHIGVMPDTSNLYQHMSALEFLKFMSELKGLKLKKGDLQQLLDDVGLGNTRKAKIKDFSFGMKKKVSLAQALLGNPSIIVLDEPTSGLDPESAIHVQNIIRNLKQSNKTVFITSHNMDEIEKICDRIAIMHKGEIKKVGTIEELRREYQSKIRVNVQSIPVLTEKNLPVDLKHMVKITDVFSDKSFIEIDQNDNIHNVLVSLIQNGFIISNYSLEKVELEEIFLSV